MMPGPDAHRKDNKSIRFLSFGSVDEPSQGVLLGFETDRLGIEVIKILNREVFEIGVVVAPAVEAELQNQIDPQDDEEDDADDDA